MEIRPFGVEQWMNEFENHCEYNLAETCVASLTIEELLQLSGNTDAALGDLLSMKMTYGAIEGSDRLRDAICKLYRHQQPGNVVVTHGAIGANALVYQALVSRGDHVVSVLPTYQQHYSIPESLGACGCARKTTFCPISTSCAACCAAVRAWSRSTTRTIPPAR